MTCEHLIEVEQALIDAGMAITSRGQAWSKVREWVYFDCVIDLAACRKLFELASCVEDHEHIGTHDGCELGLSCELCKDGVMGRHPELHSSDHHFPI